MICDIITYRYGGEDGLVQGVADDWSREREEMGGGGGPRTGTRKTTLSQPTLENSKWIRPASLPRWYFKVVHTYEYDAPTSYSSEVEDESARQLGSPAHRFALPAHRDCASLALYIVR